LAIHTGGFPIKPTAAFKGMILYSNCGHHPGDRETSNRSFLLATTSQLLPPLKPISTLVIFPSQLLWPSPSRISKQATTVSSTSPLPQDLWSISLWSFTRCGHQYKLCRYSYRILRSRLPGSFWYPQCLWITTLYYQ